MIISESKQLLSTKFFLHREVIAVERYPKLFLITNMAAKKKAKKVAKKVAEKAVKKKVAKKAAKRKK